MDSAWQTLFNPFERGEINLPGAGEHWLFSGAAPGFRLPEGFAADLTLIQGFKPWFDAFKSAGHTVQPEILAGQDRFDGALVLMSRDRGETEKRLFAAAMAVKPGGMIVIAGAKHDGAPALRKRLAQSVPGLSAASKHHGIVMWFARPDDRATEHVLPYPEPLPLVEGRFRTVDGAFSSGHADPGSALLVEHLPPDLKGAVADFGAGWGYLPAMVAERCPNVTAIDLYEANHAALEAARVNLAGTTPECGFFWHDIAGEPVTKRYATIVMNPPFHTGRKAEPELGQAFIARAAEALLHGGRLFLVANRQLPYEAQLARRFRTVSLLAETNLFKVLLAVR